MIFRFSKLPLTPSTQTKPDQNGAEQQAFCALHDDSRVQHEHRAALGKSELRAGLVPNLPAIIVQNLH